MKKYHHILGMTLLGLIFMGGVALAENITIADTVLNSSSSNSWWNTANEDQEVEPNSPTGQQWDLEAFVLNGTKLIMIGGSNFKSGVRMDGYTYRSGDIFLDVNGDAIYGSAPNPGNTVPGDYKVANIFGYDYALRMNFADMTYKINVLTPTSQLITVNLGENFDSNPWRYDSGTRRLGSFSFDFLAGLSDAEILDLYDVALQGGSHYAVVLDLLTDFQSLGITLEQFYAHFTMESGIDNLMGDPPLPACEVPIPPTVFLWGTGLGGVFLLGKRRKRD
jgi:hypothetical protein